jgi:hypothetical protein
MKYYYDRYWGIFSIHALDAQLDQTSLPAYIHGFGYSGQAQYLNNLLYQADHNTGPLPAGTYTITAINDDPHRGAHTCVLTPNPANQMFGRSGFLIHGDTANRTHTASDGCIITPLWVRQQFEVGDVVEVV